MGKGWRGGKRIINKVMKGRLSTCSLEWPLPPAWSLSCAKDWELQVIGGGEDDPVVALQADEKDSLYPSQHLLFLLSRYSLHRF